MDSHDGVQRLGRRHAIEGGANGFDRRRASARDRGGDFMRVHRSSPQISTIVPQKARTARPTNAPPRSERLSTAAIRTGVTNNPAYEAVSTAPVVSPIRS